MSINLSGLWATVWSKCRTLWKAVANRIWVGATILAIAALIYLEPYGTGGLACSRDALGALFADRPVEWACFKDVLDDLREDGTAATVILAIAAAILASGWSSGSSPAE